MPSHSGAQDETVERLRERITAVESEIEDLAAVQEGCRKGMALARAAVGVGGVAFIVSALGLIGSHPEILVLSVGACLGGAVWFGASRSSSLEAAAKIAALETLRGRMIDGLALRTLPE